MLDYGTVLHTLYLQYGDIFKRYDTYDFCRDIAFWRFNSEADYIRNRIGAEGFDIGDEVDLGLARETIDLIRAVGQQQMALARYQEELEKRNKR